MAEHRGYRRYRRYRRIAGMAGRWEGIGTYLRIGRNIELIVRIFQKLRILVLAARTVHLLVSQAHRAPPGGKRKRREEEGGRRKAEGKDRERDEKGRIGEERGGIILVVPPSQARPLPDKTG